MPSRTVEQSRQTALRAFEYAKQFNLQGNTHSKFGGLTPDKQKDIFFKINAMRSVVSGSSAYSLGLDADIDRFAQSVAMSKGTNLGNCGENASLALDHIVNHEPDAYAEVYQMDPAVDHVFCIVDRDKNSDPTKPETWGENAYVCDPWGDEVYPASELTKPRSYKASEAQHKPTPDNYMNIEVKAVEATFDPSKHKIEPQEKLNTDYIRNTKSKENADAIVGSFQKKSEIILSALDTLSKDLEKEAKRLDKDKSSIGTEKANVIKEKMAAVQDEIARIKDDVKENIPNRQDYAAARAQLESKLQTAVANTNKLTQLDAAHEQTLNKQKNPMWDKLVGKTAPKSAMAVQEAMTKARDTLNTLNNPVAPQAASEASPQPKSPAVAPSQASAEPAAVAAKSESQPEINASPQSVPPAIVPETQAEPVSQPTSNMPGHAATAPIPASQLNNQEQMPQPAAQVPAASEPRVDNDPSPVAMSPPPDSAAPEQLHDAPVNEKASDDASSKAPTPEPSEQAASEESADVPSDESNAQFSEAPEPGESAEAEQPNNDPEPVEMDAAPDSSSGDEYQFPDVPDHELADFPDVPEEEPGEASESSNKNKEKERDDPIPS